MKFENIRDLEVIKSLTSENNYAVKWLLKADDGALIECVDLQTTKHATLCVSTQIGCELGCKFCATGACGFERNLTSEEISGQLKTVRINRGEKLIPTNKPGKKLEHIGPPPISHIVFMGMGEPFLNFENFIQAVEIFQNQAVWSKNNSAIRSLSVSTVGIPDKIIELAESKPTVRLAVSLHASNNELRSQLMPANNKWPIEDILNATSAHQRITKKPTMFEYICIRNLNDTPDHAHELAKLLREQHVFVNLIPFNNVENSSYERSLDNDCLDFLKILKNHGIEGRIRTERGVEINGACGQLVRRHCS